MRFHSNSLQAKLSFFNLSAGVFNINKKETEFGGTGQRGGLPESSNKDTGGRPYFSQKKSVCYPFPEEKYCRDSGVGLSCFHAQALEN